MKLFLHAKRFVVGTICHLTVTKGLVLKDIADIFLLFYRPDAIEEILKEHTSFHRLFLNDNQITVVPEDIKQLSFLEDLYLSSNRIATISPHIGALGKSPLARLTFG